VFGIIARRGMLPQPPQKLLDNPDYKIEFVSKIALSIKKIESLGWLQTEAAIANVAARNPEVMDNFLDDEIVRDISLVNGSSPGWLRSVRERDQIRAERAQAQAEQMAAQEMLAGAGALGNNLGKAPEKGSPLETIMSNSGV
jgi:hypothetical protein